MEEAQFEILILEAEDAEADLHELRDELAAIHLATGESEAEEARLRAAIAAVESDRSSLLSQETGRSAELAEQVASETRRRERLVAVTDLVAQPGVRTGTHRRGYLIRPQSAQQAREIAALLCPLVDFAPGALQHAEALGCWEASGLLKDLFLLHQITHHTSGAPQRWITTARERFGEALSAIEHASPPRRPGRARKPKRTAPGRGGGPYGSWRVIRSYPEHQVCVDVAPSARGRITVARVFTHDLGQPTP